MSAPNPKSLIPQHFISFLPLTILGSSVSLTFSYHFIYFLPRFIVGFQHSFPIFYFCSFSAIPISFIFPLPVSHQTTLFVSVYYFCWQTAAWARNQIKKSLPLLCSTTKENIKVKSWSSCTIYLINGDAKLSFMYFKHLKHRYF